MKVRGQNSNRNMVKQKVENGQKSWVTTLRPVLRHGARGQEFEAAELS